jgi:hypothetical protein
MPDMIQEIKLHGKANDKMDYFVTITGADLSSRYCYESLPEGDRFFSGRNEFIISPDGISYTGTGGSLCEYMFGVDLPLKDLLRKDVSNRLVMYGAFYDNTDNITFTNTTSGKESFDHVFLTGNAVSNYFFFVHSSFQKENRDIQRDILKYIGKQLKRSTTVGATDDTRLCREIFDAFGDAKSLVFLFRLHNRHNGEYFNTFNKFYAEQKMLSPQALTVLDELADQYQIIPYQQERIKIDGMYKLPENKKIVDEYKDILISVSEKGEINASELAKLSRLRTLSLRLNIPHTLFDTLDELLLKDMQIVEVEEPDCEGHAGDLRVVLGDRQDQGPPLGRPSSSVAKQRSRSEDQAFEGLLLDTVRACDEHAQDTRHVRAQSPGSSDLLRPVRQRIEHDQQSRVHGELDLSEGNIRASSGNKRSSTDRPYLFTRYSSTPPENPHDAVQPEKVDTLFQGSADQDRRHHLRERADPSPGSTKTNSTPPSPVHQDHFKTSMRVELQEDRIFIQDLNREIQSRRIVQGPVPHNIFEEIILDIRKESFYLNNLLPHIVVSQDSRVREDFLLNSGLDRFYIEELENDYFDMNKIDKNILEEIRR